MRSFNARSSVLLVSSLFGGALVLALLFLRSATATSPEGTVLTEVQMAFIFGDSPTPTDPCVKKGKCVDPFPGGNKNCQGGACVKCDNADQTSTKERTYCCKLGDGTQCNGNGGGTPCSGLSVWFTCDFQTNTDSCSTCTAATAWRNWYADCLLQNATGGDCPAK
jgi:hypothetical protein